LDLRSCRQKPDESLRDFIRRFSKQCTELPNITDSDVIGAFISGTTCKELVHELGRKTPMSTSQLLDIATNFASGEEAVGAIFSDGAAKGKQKAEATEASGSHDSKKKKKGRKGKQGQSNDNLVAAADRKNPKRAPAGPGLFDEMLKKSYPYHKGPTKHTLEECTVLHQYYTDLISKEGTEEPPKDDDPSPDLTLPRPLRPEGGKLHLVIEEGGQGIPGGSRGVFKPLHLLLGLRLIVGEDVALTNRRQVNAGVVRAHYRQGFLHPGVERLPHPLPGSGVKGFDPTLQRRLRCRHLESLARRGDHDFKNRAVRNLGIKGPLQGPGSRSRLDHLPL